MKVTVQKVAEINEALKFLANIDGLYCSYEIAKNLNLVKDTVEKLESDRKKLIDTHVLKDKDGVYKTKGENNELNDFSDKEKEFLKKANEMLAEDIEIKFVEITREDIKDSKGERINPPAVVLMHLDGTIIKDGNQ